MSKHTIEDTWFEKWDGIRYRAMCSCGEVFDDTAEDFERHLATTKKGNK